MHKTEPKVHNLRIMYMNFVFIVIAWHCIIWLIMCMYVCMYVCVCTCKCKCTCKCMCAVGRCAANGNSYDEWWWWLMSDTRKKRSYFSYFDAHHHSWIFSVSISFHFVVGCFVVVGCFYYYGASEFNSNHTKTLTIHYFHTNRLVTVWMQLQLQ